MRLTIKEIRDLAEFAGLTVDDSWMRLDDLESEITISDNAKERYAYYSEYPDEGAIRLGQE